MYKNMLIFSIFCSFGIIALSYASISSCTGNSHITCSSINISNPIIDVGQTTQITINGISSSTNLMSGNWLFSGSNIISSNTITFQLNTSYLGNWQKQNTYLTPTNISWGQSCNMVSNTIYCIGGLNYNQDLTTNEVIYSGITTAGLTAWNSNSYPVYPYAVMDQSCVPYNSIIYCIGGNQKSEHSQGNYLLNNVYYSNTLTSSAWSQGLSYPENISSQFCGAYNAMIFCVGGTNETSNIITSGNQTYPKYYYNVINVSYYSVLQQSGVPGSWDWIYLWKNRLYANYLYN